MAMSDSPKRVHNAHAHRGNARQKSADDSNCDGNDQAQAQNRWCKHKTRKQAIQRCRERGHSKHRERQSQQSPDQRNDERFSENKKQHCAVRKANCFEHSQLGCSLADGNRHGVAGDQQQREKNHYTDRQDQKLNVAELLDPTRSESGFGLRLRFKRRIRELGVNRFCHAHGIVGTIQAKDVPADLPFHAFRNFFLKIIPLKPELRLVVLRTLAVIDAHKVELPCATAVKRSFDGNPVTYFPAESLRCACTGNRTLTIFQKRTPLVVRNHQFWNDLALVFRIDHELREKVLFILIDPAKPVIVCYVLHARDAQNLVAIGKRNRIDDGRPIDNHEPVRACDIGSAPERVPHHCKKREQEQRYGERANGQDQPHFFAEEICENQPGEFHATPPAMAFCGSLLPSTSTPFSRCSVVCARSATTGSWVTINTVFPCWATNSSINCMISVALLRSRSPVGSSHNRNVGSDTIARAIVTRCSCPPESCRG